MLLLFSVAALLGGLRLHFLAGDLGYYLPARDVLVTVCLSNLAGALTVQFFGQIVARSALLKSRGIDAPVTIVLTLYERIISLALLALIGGAGAFFLFHGIKIQKAQLPVMLQFISAILVAGLAGAAVGWGRLCLKTLDLSINLTSFVRVVRGFAITLLIQLCTLASYVFLAKTFAVEVPLAQLTAACAVVMFAASLPLSFAGWGIRELTSIFALSVVGVSAADAIVIAVLIGLLSTLAVVAVYLLSILLPVNSTARGLISSNRRVNISALVQWVLPLSVATLIVFQVHVPRGATALAVNIADPFALLSVIIFAFAYFSRRVAGERQIPMEVWIVGSAVIFACAYANAFIRFGANDWAFSKLIGWGVLIAYASSGALIVLQGRRLGFVVLARTFCGVAASSVLFNIFSIALHAVGWGAKVRLPLEGYLQNRNAFSMVLLTGLCFHVFLSPKIRQWVFGIILLGLWLAGSRAAIGAAAVMILLYIATGHLKLKSLSLSLASIGAILVSIHFVANFEIQDQKIFNSLGARNVSVITPAISGPESDQERMWSITEGFKLFLQHPITGAGLGSFIEQQKEGKRVTAVIHSTPVWLLAEFGLIATIALLGPILIFLARSVGTLWSNSASGFTREVSASFVAIALGFGTMALAHEMLYQRVVWLAAGAIFAVLLLEYDRRRPGAQAATKILDRASA